MKRQTQMRTSMPLRRRAFTPDAQRGVSLVELMVGIVIGLLIVAALTTLFVNNSRARNETEKLHAQIENGRFATQLLAEDLRMAGYLGEFDPSSLPSPASLPNLSAVDVASLSAAAVLPVQGIDGATSASALPSVVTDELKAGTDVIVVRRASGCVAGVSGCEGVNTASMNYFQTTLCDSELSTLPASGQFVLSRDKSAFTLMKRNCDPADRADMRAFFVRIYFVANNNQPGDGVPTLKVAELRGASFVVTPLVEGIEQLQVEYGMDTTTGDQGAPDLYSSTPESVAKSGGGTYGADGWRVVTTVRLHLLARNLQGTAGYTDGKEYVLAGNPFTFSDSFKRKVFTTTVRLNNVAGRLE